DNDGWIRVNRNKAKRFKDHTGRQDEMTDQFRSNISTGNHNFSSLEKISTSVYITNLPWKATTKEVWVECEKWGTVVDVFISSKTSMAGARFGFFKRMGQPIPTKVNTYSGVPQKNRMVAKSFVAAVHQGSHDSWSRNQVYVQKKNDIYVEKQATGNKSISPYLVKRNLELSDDDCLSFESNKSSFLARAMNIQIIHQLHSILENNGFTNF
ncbi:RNA-directed DNA polymerase, eukaryota, reverse transcriptase zinc-binding domain protein, partial [Tanacetum coccineum]